MPGNWFYPGSGETTECPIPTAPGDKASPYPATGANADAAGAAAAEEDGGGGGDDDGGDGKVAAAGEVLGKAEAGPSVNSAAGRDVSVASRREVSAGGARGFQGNSVELEGVERSF